MIDLTEEQIERYSRHILLQDVGLEGQEKLLNAKVLIIGAGGLGSPVALYLAAAGVGHIGIVDADVVDLSNLQRQVIPSDQGLGHSKGGKRQGEDDCHQSGCGGDHLSRLPRFTQCRGNHQAMGFRH